MVKKVKALCLIIALSLLLIGCQDKYEYFSCMVNETNEQVLMRIKTDELQVGVYSTGMYLMLPESGATVADLNFLSLYKCEEDLLKKNIKMDSVIWLQGNGYKYYEYLGDTGIEYIIVPDSSECTCIRVNSITSDKVSMDVFSFE